MFLKAQDNEWSTLLLMGDFPSVQYGLVGRYSSLPMSGHGALMTLQQQSLRCRNLGCFLLLTNGRCNPMPAGMLDLVPGVARWYHD